MILSSLCWVAADQLVAAKVACQKTSDMQALRAKHVDWSQVMRERFTCSHSDGFLLLQVYKLLILGFVAGVWVVNNTSCIAQLSLLGHRGIRQTRAAAQDYAAVFAEAVGAFVKRGRA
jgi:hypothetical protein